MELLLYSLVFIFHQYFVKSAQPYFPEQVIFTPDNNQTIIAIDEINQRAYLKLNISDTIDTAYVMQHFPYAKSGSPQSDHYVQLIVNQLSSSDSCSYLTYWEYSFNAFGLFPLHWGNDSSYRIKNYLNFKYPMIRNSSKSDEDNWFSNETCRVDTGEIYHCQEIFFQKNTNIPIRYSEVILQDNEIIRRIESYTIYSTEKPKDTYFESIPKNWTGECRNGDLGILYNPDKVTIKLKQSEQIQVWLPSPPDQVHNNDTVIIYWRTLLCKSCFHWTPTRLVFNGTNLHQKQLLTITRLQDSEEDLFIPFCKGGGYDKVPCYAMYLTID